MDASRHHHIHHLRPSSKAVFLINTQASSSSQRFPSSSSTTFDYSVSRSSHFGLQDALDASSNHMCPAGTMEKGVTHIDGQPSRRLLIPSWYTLLQLHVVLQIAYGLPDVRQPHSFEVKRLSHDVAGLKRTPVEEPVRKVSGGDSKPFGKSSGEISGGGGRQHREGFHPSTHTSTTASKELLLGGGILIDANGVHHHITPSTSVVGTTTFAGKRSAFSRSTSSSSLKNHKGASTSYAHDNDIDDEEDEEYDECCSELSTPISSPPGRAFSPTPYDVKSIRRRRSDDASLGTRPAGIGGMVGSNVGQISKSHRRTSLQTSSMASVAPHAEGVRRRKNGAKQIDSFGESSPGKKGDSVKFEVADRKMMGKIDMIRYKIVEPQSDLVLTQYAPACYIQHSHPHARPTTVFSDDAGAYEFSFFENVRDERFFQLEEVLSKSHPSLIYKYYDFSKESIIEITVNLNEILPYSSKTDPGPLLPRCVGGSYFPPKGNTHTPPNISRSIPSASRIPVPSWAGTKRPQDRVPKNFSIKMPFKPDCQDKPDISSIEVVNFFLWEAHHADGPLQRRSLLPPAKESNCSFMPNMMDSSSSNLFSFPGPVTPMNCEMSESSSKGATSAPAISFEGNVDNIDDSFRLRKCYLCRLYGCTKSGGCLPFFFQESPSYPLYMYLNGSSSAALPSSFPAAANSTFPSSLSMTSAGNALLNFTTRRPSTPFIPPTSPNSHHNDDLHTSALNPISSVLGLQVPSPGAHSSPSSPLQQPIASTMASTSNLHTIQHHVNTSELLPPPCCDVCPYAVRPNLDWNPTTAPISEAAAAALFSAKSRELQRTRRAFLEGGGMCVAWRETDGSPCRMCTGGVWGSSNMRAFTPATLFHPFGRSRTSSVTSEVDNGMDVESDDPYDGRSAIPAVPPFFGSGKMIDDDFGVYREAKVDEAAGGRSAFFDGQYTDGYLRASGDGDGQVLSSFKRKHTSGDVLGGGVQVDIRCAKCVKRSLGDASCFECAKMGNSSSSPRNVAYPSPIELYAPSLIDEGAHSWDHSGPPVTTRPRSAFRSGKWNQHGMGESAIQYGTGFMGDD